MEEILVVAAIIVRPDGRILVTKRPATGSAANKWEFPGGKVEIGESPQQALIREIHEELGITISNPRFFGEFPTPFNNKLICLRCYVVEHSCDAIELRSHQAMDWYYADEFRNSEFAKPDLPAIEQLRKIGTGVDYPAAHISDEIFSRTEPVSKDQAHVFALIIRQLETSLLAHFQIDNVGDIPVARYGEMYSLPEFSLLNKAARACRFVCRDYRSSFDVEAVTRAPVPTLSSLSFSDLRRYVHGVVRGEHWAGGFGSPILEAIKSGALSLVADRLLNDRALYKRD